MTAHSLDRIGGRTAAPTPDRIGQQTAVEQSRAVAEVQAAVVVAQQVPRDVQLARSAMRDSCQQMALAERAFFRYSRAGSQITGPSVHLARELARCWGNVQYGVAELRRDDIAGQSEMQAYAWDVQTNTRSAAVFIVPHARDTKQGRRDLTDLRDVYENNANNGARRVREAIFAVLPPWFTEEAKSLCNETLAGGGGRPLADRIADARQGFAKAGITDTQLEDRLGKKVGKWDEHDVAQLHVIYTSLVRGETTREDEFPTQRVTAAEVRGKPADREPPPEDQPHAEVGESPPLDTSSKLARHMFAMFREVGIEAKPERLAFVSDVVSRDVTTSSELSEAEADQVIAALQRMRDRQRIGAEAPPEGEQ